MFVMKVLASIRSELALSDGHSITAAFKSSSAPLNVR
jgi:hypothetical protein